MFLKIFESEKQPFFILYYIISVEWETMEGTYYKTGVETLEEIKSEDIPLFQVGFQIFTKR